MFMSIDINFISKTSPTWYSVYHVSQMKLQVLSKCEVLRELSIYSYTVTFFSIFGNTIRKLGKYKICLSILDDPDQCMK